MKIYALITAFFGIIHLAKAEDKQYHFIQKNLDAAIEKSIKCDLTYQTLKSASP